MDRDAPWCLKYKPATTVSLALSTCIRYMLLIVLSGSHLPICVYVLQTNKVCSNVSLLQDDLAVHKKKVLEVQQWLEFALSSVSCKTGCHLSLSLSILKSSLSIMHDIYTMRGE